MNTEKQTNIKARQKQLKNQMAGGIGCQLNTKNWTIPKPPEATQNSDGSWSTEIRKRAERRGGELMAEQRAAGELAKGSAQRGVGRRGKNAGPQETRIPLSDQGIDKHLADRMRKQRKIQMAGGIGSQLNSEKRANLDIVFRA